MQGLLKVSRAIDSLSELLGKIAIYLTLVLVAVGFYNVVARFLGRFIGQNLSSNRFIETRGLLET